MQAGAVNARYAEDKPWSCDYCPYGRNRPCIGFCMQKLLMEMQTEKNEERGNQSAG